MFRLQMGNSRLKKDNLQNINCNKCQASRFWSYPLKGLCVAIVDLWIYCWIILSYDFIKTDLKWTNRFGTEVSKMERNVGWSIYQLRNEVWQLFEILVEMLKLPAPHLRHWFMWIRPVTELQLLENGSGLPAPIFSSSIHLTIVQFGQFGQ